MKNRVHRCFASLLALIYLWAVGAGALSSLLCPCLARHHHAAHAVCCCEHHATQAGSASATHDACCSSSAERFAGSCCTTPHSNEVNLYTAGEKDAERRLWRQAQPLLVAVVLDRQPSVTPNDLFESPLRLAPTPCTDTGVVSARSLRAPPVTA